MKKIIARVIIFTVCISLYGWDFWYLPLTCTFMFEPHIWNVLVFHFGAGCLVSVAFIINWAIKVGFK